MRLNTLLFYFLLFISFSAHSQNDSTRTLNDSLKSKPFSFHGYTELYYSYNPYTGESEKNLFYNYRRNNQISINLALISFAYNTDNFRAALGIQAGDYTTFNLSHEHKFFRHLNEAYAGIRVCKNGWIDAGVFAAHIGYEGPIGKNNWNLTRAFNADNVPYYETGLRFNYLLNSKWTFNVFILNGWQRMKENNSSPAFGTQISCQANDNVYLNYSTFIGNEQPEGSKAKMRYFNDLYAIINLTDKLGLSASFNIGFQEKEGPGMDVWYNPTINTRYIISKLVTVASRLEYYHDPNQTMVYTGTPYGFKTFGASANIDFNINKYLLYRIEARGLFAADDVVFDGTAANRKIAFYTTALSYSF